MAMGVIQSAIGLFGNVPCPIIYGAVVDSACLIWKSVCGKHGACSLYDADTFRQYFLGEFREDERQKINNITSFDYKLWSLAFNRISLVKEFLKLIL